MNNPIVNTTKYFHGSRIRLHRDTIEFYRRLFFFFNTEDFFKCADLNGKDCTSNKILTKVI